MQGDVTMPLSLFCVVIVVALCVLLLLLEVLASVWVMLEGEDQPGMVTMDANSNIFQLKKAIHTEYPNQLAGIDPGKLKICLKKGDTEAL